MKLNTQKAEFIISAAKKADYPDNNIPHIIFSGRSNAGKSSIINKLLNRKNLARTSQEPGKTRNVNLFMIDQTVYFADLPGYGYAKVSAGERRRWADNINGYLAYAAGKALCIQIVDIRHKPTADDCTMVDWLRRSGVAYVVVANKSDKLSVRQIGESVKVIRETLRANTNIPVIPFSAEKGSGTDELLEVINTWLESVENERKAGDSEK